MDISFVVPVYNEAGTILAVVRRLSALPFDKEILVVDDGSTDGTRERLREIRDPSVRTLLHPWNQGKGAAIRTGLAECRGRVIAVQDADLELDPEEFLKLLPPVLDGRCAVMYGSRFLRAAARPGDRSWWANRILTLLTDLMFAATITDMETCYKVFRADVVQGLHLECRRFEFEPEVTAKLILAGHRIVEMPIAYRPRTVVEGKKISWRDAVTAVEWLVRCRLGLSRVRRRAVDCRPDRPGEFRT